MIFSKIDTEIIRYPYAKEWIWTLLYIQKGFPDGSVVKSTPVKQETQVWSPGGEDPLEEGMTTYSSILVWRIHGLRSLAGYSP